MRRSLWPFALGLLVLVDLLLVALAIRSGSATDAATPTPAATSSTSSATSATAGGSSTSSSTASTSSAPTRLIVVPVNRQSAWRITSGSTCQGAGSSAVTLSRTTDAGSTWSAGPKVSLRAVMSATTDTSGAVLLSGLSADCKPSVVKLSQDSAQAADSTPAWSVDPSAPDHLLRAGQQTSAAACRDGAVRDLATDSADRANVLCPGGAVRRTVDGGATWRTVATVTKAIGISTAGSSQNHKLYVASSADCGVRVTAPADGSGPGCASGSAKQGPADIALWGRWMWVARGDHAQVVTLADATQSSSSSSSSSSADSSSSSSDSSGSGSSNSSSTSSPTSTSAG